MSHTKSGSSGKSAIICGKDKKGLIRSNGRNGLRRLFAANVIERLALISLGRNAGFSLDEIGDMFTPEGADINRQLLAAKADELDAKIKELTAMREGLRHAVACKHPNHFECPKFLRLLRVAGRKQSRQSKGRGQGIRTALR